MSALKYLPKENTWVLGKCKFTTNFVIGENAIIWTQVKYQKDKGWSDWCGDMMIDVDMEVIDWVPLPVTGVV